MIARHLFALAACAALAAGAGRATAEEPKAAKADLADLKDAVARADKKGENVDAIREALATFEKALAKGAKAGEAPPELTALREAVETAVRKGENVEAISKELGLVEKALTGREYERPKPPQPPPAAEPFPQQPGRPFPPPRRAGGGIVIAPGGSGFNATSVTISNGMFTVKARLGDVNYTLTGSTAGTESPKIVIQDGEKKIETDDLKKVPDEYRPATERLLKMVSRP